MLRKKTTYTNITPIPSNIPRQLAIDILHSHSEIIELNPLVIGFEPIKAPRDAPSDEFYATWYEISQRIQYIPGVGKMGSGTIKFKGCFHDMPWGLQTHIYAPASVDLRNKWQICGNQQGEPPQTAELGIGAPPEGLYLREDIEIKCNVAMVNFVKKENKAASKVLVERLIKKAELLDAGVLSAMMENGRLKTLNPADRTNTGLRPQSPLASPKQQPYTIPMSPGRAEFSQDQFKPHGPQGQNNVIMELPGDFYHAPPPQRSPNFLHPNPSYRDSTASELSGHSPPPSDGRWSHVSGQSPNSSRPSSYASDGMRSPGMDQKGFATELPTMQETREEEHAGQYPDDRKYRYNPQDYANVHQYPQTPHPSQQQQNNQPVQYAPYTMGR